MAASAKGLAKFTKRVNATGKALHREMIETKAALMLQSVFRGSGARKEAKRKKEEKIMEKAVIKIQAVWRGRMARKLVAGKIREQQLQERAAILIQRAYRRRRGKIYKASQEEQDRIGALMGLRTSELGGEGAKAPLNLLQVLKALMSLDRLHKAETLHVFEFLLGPMNEPWEEERSSFDALESARSSKSSRPASRAVTRAEQNKKKNKFVAAKKKKDNGTDSDEDNGAPLAPGFGEIVVEDSELDPQVPQLPSSSGLSPAQIRRLDKSPLDCSWSLQLNASFRSARAVCKKWNTILEERVRAKPFRWFGPIENAATAPPPAYLFRRPRPLSASGTPREHELQQDDPQEGSQYRPPPSEFEVLDKFQTRVTGLNFALPPGVLIPRIAHELLTRDFGRNLVYFHAKVVCSMRVLQTLHSVCPNLTTIRLERYLVIEPLFSGSSSSSSPSSALLRRVSGLGNSSTRPLVPLSPISSSQPVRDLCTLQYDTKFPQMTEWCRGMRTLHLAACECFHELEPLNQLIASFQLLHELTVDLSEIQTLPPLAVSQLEFRHPTLRRISISGLKTDLPYMDAPQLVSLHIENGPKSSMFKGWLPSHTFPLLHSLSRVPTTLGFMSEVLPDRLSNLRSLSLSLTPRFASLVPGSYLSPIKKPSSSPSSSSFAPKTALAAYQSSSAAQAMSAAAEQRALSDHLNQCTQLTHLELSADSTYLKFPILLDISLPNLTSLFVSNAEQLEGFSVSAVCTSLRHLRISDLTRAPWLTPTTGQGTKWLERTVNQLPRLHHLEVHQWRSLASTLKMQTDSLTHLRLESVDFYALDLSGCSALMYLDTTKCTFSHRMEFELLKAQCDSLQEFTFAKK